MTVKRGESNVSSLFKLKGMRKFLCSILSLVLAASALSAQKGSIEARSRDDLLHKLDMSVAYVLPEFTDCQVHWLDGRMTASPLNICAFDNSARFIAGRDTMIVRNIDNVDFILSPDRKFVYRDKMLLELLRETPDLSLAEKKRLRISEPKMEQGSYGAIPASSSARTTTTDDYRLSESRSYGRLVSVDYSVSWDYYLIDGEGNVTKAGRKAFLDVFPGMEDEIKAIIRQRKLKLDERDDVLYLYDYCLNGIK